MSATNVHLDLLLIVKNGLITVIDGGLTMLSGPTKGADALEFSAIEALDSSAVKSAVSGIARAGKLSCGGSRADTISITRVRIAWIVIINYYADLVLDAVQ